MRTTTKRKMTGDAYRHHRKKWMYIKRFLRRIEQMIMIGFEDFSGKLSDTQRFNQTMKANRGILGGISPKFYLLFSNVVVSKGSLPAPLNSFVRYISPRIVEVKWENAETEPTGKKMIYVFKYNATRKLPAIYVVEADEPVQMMDIRFPEEEYGDEVHFWLTFVWPDKKKRTNSAYIGQILPLSN